jgi:hypothetical protein
MKAMKVSGTDKRQIEHFVRLENTKNFSKRESQKRMFGTSSSIYFWLCYYLVDGWVKIRGEFPVKLKNFHFSI